MGWINFGPTQGGVTIDEQGNFEGWAWGENTGWLRFDSEQTYNVQACTVTLEDLQIFASRWLDTVNNNEFALLAQHWRDFCPEGWKLKH